MMQHHNIDCARTQSSHLKTFPCPPLISCQFLVTFQIMQPVTECPISCRDLDMFLIQDKSQLSPGQRSVTLCVIFSWETPWQMWWVPPTRLLLAYTAVSRTIWPPSNNESQQTITSIMQEKFHFLLVFHLKNFTPYILTTHDHHCAIVLIWTICKSKPFKYCQYSKFHKSNNLSLKILVFAVFRVQRVNVPTRPPRNAIVSVKPVKLSWDTKQPKRNDGKISKIPECKAHKNYSNKRSGVSERV